jgi:predicted phage terminase large subunit-like protein
MQTPTPQLTPEFLAKRSRLEKWAIELARTGRTDDEIQALFEQIPARVRRAMFFDWRAKGRPQQHLPEGRWRFWLALPGRGWGKTATGGHAVKEWEQNGAGRIALIGATAADARDVMVTGETGILAAYPRRERPMYRKSLRCVDFHKTGGGKAFLYSAEEPERLRGPQHHKGWLDELAAWEKPELAFAQFKFGLRLGQSPQGLITTTPKTIEIVLQLLAESQDPSGRIVVTRGSTFDNAMNLPDDFLEEMIKSFGGTRLGRQELEGEVLEDVDALFRAEWIHHADTLPELRRTIVAIDPAIRSQNHNDETGIIVCALGVDGRGYVLADRSGRLSPDAWAKRVLSAFDDFDANLILAETNRGGEMVGNTLKTLRPHVPFKEVQADKGKGLRAEPVAALYEQGRVSHAERFATLEKQLTTWNPKESPESPDRLDALVWGLRELMCKPGAPKIQGGLPSQRPRLVR